jgi:hypothetical protein
MKTVKIALDDDVLAALVTEQVARLPDLKIGGDNPQLIIARVKTPESVPHLLLGGKREEGVEVLTLPLRLGELNDRIRYMLSDRTRFAKNDLVEFGPFTLSAEDGTMSCPATGQSARLTDKEKLVILSLHTAPAQTLDRVSLLRQVWGYVETAETHTLETHLYRLRQKIEDTFGVKDLIVTRDGLYTLKI